ncbi:uncharacterized protein Daxx isoform X2 [Diabrotica undecimpunctata]|uniref:uncharacterized protein Daxx isoform X2 n=1 Tax=Diabrotica undecimpunctata TaxID=50387 RepID=UPI003B63BF6A
MEDIITLSSSDEDEEQIVSPRKRIKPTPVPNLPNITITKVSTEQCKEPEIVSLCSDEETNVVPDDIELTPINRKKMKKLKNPLHKKIPDPVVICDDEIESPPPKQQSNGDSHSIKENTSVVKENQSESSNVESTNSNNKKDSRSQDDTTINESIEINDEDIGPESDDNEDKQLLNDLECTVGTSKDGDSENLNNNLSEDVIPDDVQPCSSTSAEKPSNKFLLKKFLGIVERNIKHTKYVTILEKFPMLRTFYNKCIDEFETSTGFQRILTENIAKAKKSSIQSVLCFNEVFQHLKEAVKTGSIEVDREQLIKLKKLEKTIKRLVVIIKRLEETEIDFDLEEDSSYLQLGRYMARLDKVYKKYCELMKKNPYGNRLTYSKLVFLDSEYNEINRAIIRTYKNNKKFPSYYDIEKLITKVVKDSALNLNESQIKTESKTCFQKLGELLQRRRRRELYESHYVHLEDTEDPASADTDLNSVLRNNYLEAQSKIEKLVQEYVTKQDNKQFSGEEELEEEEEGEKEAISEESSSDDSESEDDTSDDTSDDSSEKD